MIKQIIVFLLLILAHLAISKPLLKGGVDLEGKYYFFLTNGKTLSIVDKNNKLITQYQNISMFDYSDNNFITIFSDNSFIILDKNLNPILNSTINLHPFWKSQKLCNKLYLIKNNLVIVPDTTPYIYDITTENKYIIPVLFSLNKLTLTLNTFEFIKISENWLSFVNDGVAYFLNYKTGQKMNLYVNGNSLTKFQLIENQLSIEIDEKNLYLFDLNKLEVIRTEEISKKNKDSIVIEHSFGELNDFYQVEIKVMDTSIFSALSAWKKGVGNGEISVLNSKNEEIFKKAFTFSLKQLNNSNFDIKIKQKFITINLPEKDLVVLKQKNIKCFTLEKSKNYCLCGNRIFVFENNKINLFSK